LSNPLDYHTYIWGDGDAQRACFSAMLDGNQDITLKLLDFPPPGDDSRYEGWNTTLDALAAASACTGRRAVLVMTLAEILPNDFLVRLVDLGIVPMFGINECLVSIRAAADVGARQREATQIQPLIGAESIDVDTAAMDEWQSKAMLRQAGIDTPPGMLVGIQGVAEAAEQLGFPVVLKAVAADLPHKTDAGAVRVGLRDSGAVHEAAGAMSELSDRYLVERMIEHPVAELLVGVTRDPRYGFVLVIGAGGVMVELLDDVATLLLPVSESDVRMALQRLRIAKLLAGYRSRPAGDIDATVDAVMRVVRLVTEHADCLLELDINPLFVMPTGQGVIAADALIRMKTKSAAL
jgi:acetyl-CoA synthetase